MLTWVVGAGGLLGGAVSRASARTFIGSPVPWMVPVEANNVLESDLSRFVAQAGGSDWLLVWAAGGGSVASNRSDLRAEASIVEGFLAAVRRRHPAGNGAFFLASSAGGVYAGSSHPPFDESTAPRPLSAYGEAKLAQEELATRILTGSVPVLIGRLSNLYGPGQNLAKPQGLVSHLCVAAATRRALNVFVPMETLRDYLYVEDAAVMIVSWATAAVRSRPQLPITRNLASERPTPVAGLVRVVQHVARRPIPIALGASLTSRDQVRDLRVVSRDSADRVRTPITPLPVGVKRVYDHTLRVIAGHP